MGTLEHYRTVIKAVVTRWAESRQHNPIPNIETCLVIDEVHDHYLLMDIGWQGEHRVLFTKGRPRNLHHHCKNVIIAKTSSLQKRSMCCAGNLRVVRSARPTMRQPWLRFSGQ